MKVNSPTLRFGGLRGNWESYRLDQCTSFRRGSFPQPYGLSKWYDDENGKPFVQVFDVSKNFELKARTKRKISKEAESFSVFVPKDSIVLTIQGSIGRIALTQYDSFVDRTLLIFQDYKAELDKKFFMYSVYLLFQVEKRKAPGGTIKTITKDKLKSFKISIPSLSEQTKIADFLTSVDTKIQQLRRKKELLEQYKKGSMQKLFSQEIRFKDEQGNDYPDWEEKRIGDISSVTGGGTPDTLKKEYWQGNIQWFTPTEIKQKYVSTSNRQISKAGLQKSSAKLLPQGSLLFCSRATVGYVSISTLPCTTNQGFQSLTVNRQCINEFLYYWILQSQKLFLRRASGSTFLEISKKEIEKIKLLVPSLPEQTKIADFLTAIDKKINFVDTELEQLNTWKTGLLQQLFV